MVLENLKKDLPGFKGEDCTIISDQHKVSNLSFMSHFFLVSTTALSSIFTSLLILLTVSNAWCKTIFPDVEHRNCARHIWPQWHKKHRKMV